MTVRGDDRSAPWNRVTTEARARVTLLLDVSVDVAPGTSPEDREEYLRDEVMRNLEMLEDDWKLVDISMGRA